MSKRDLALYNDNDPFVCEWLRNLIAADLIMPGDVIEGSISDIIPNEITGYGQYHFFAGIGLWSLALREAGWPDNRPVWTGSCPCQPFSQASKGNGFDDERHLWPDWFHLIDTLQPDTIYGEQVASQDGLAWIDLVQADLEGAGYTVRCVDFCSAGVGAPQIGQRLFWMATTDSARSQRQPLQGQGTDQRSVGSGSVVVRKHVNGWWRWADWLKGEDGIFRPVEAGTFPLADGDTALVGKIRAYGNAINPQQAKAFIEATANEA
jgi:DNA (cytosine-5)-methyltransferase 1